MANYPPRLVAIHGLSGSGKSFVARRLRDRHGFAHASSGLICRTVTEALFGHQQRQALNHVSQAIRKIDNQIWIKAALRDASGDRIVFDSVRYLDDAHFLRILGYEIWKIICPVDICIERLKERNQVFDLSDFQHDSEKEIPDNLCRHFIRNYNRSLEQLSNEIDSLVEEAS